MIDDTEAQGERVSTPSGDCFGLVGVQLDGKYDVEAVVAEGGFGVVYRATHRGLNKIVALKVLKIPPELSNVMRMEFLAKFAQEARTVAAMDHPAIVRVLDFGAGPMPRGDAAPWMVLEWLTGTTLEADLQQRNGTPRTPTEVLSLMRPILDAMTFAHEEGVVHRDIKPPNIMLVKGRRGEIHLKILDFGIAKVMGSEARTSSGQTATASVLHAFSLHYAAPEQIGGTRTGPWTDVHALALIVSELLTGRAPYEGNDAVELYSAVLAVLRPTPLKHGFDVGVWEAVLAKALSLKPGERYSDAKAFSDALAAEIPVVGTCQMAGSLPPETQVRGGSVVITTLRPGSKNATLPATASSPKRKVGLAATVIVAGVLAGIVYEFRVRSPHRRETPANLSATTSPQPARAAFLPVTPPALDASAVIAPAANPAGALPSGMQAVARPAPRPALTVRRPTSVRHRVSSDFQTPRVVRRPQVLGEVPIE